MHIVSPMIGLVATLAPTIGPTLVKSYKSFHPSERPALIDALVARPALAKALLDGIAAGAIPRGDLSSYQARQIRTLNDADLSRKLAEAWGEGGPRFRVEPPPNAPHEAGILRLDSTKARQRLGWQPRLSLREALAMTAAWYRAQAAGADMLRLSLTQIAEYAARLRPAVLPFSVSAPQASQFSVSRG